MTPKQNSTLTEHVKILLEKYCSESVLEKIWSEVEVIRASESALVASRDAEGGDSSLEEQDLQTDYLDNIVTACKQQLPKRDCLEFLVELADLCLKDGDFSLAEEFCSNAIAGVGSGRHLADIGGQALLKRAEICLRQAKWQPALEDLKRCKQFFNRARDEFGLGRVHNHLGIYFIEQGDLRRAVSHLKRAQAMYDKSNHDGIAAALNMDLGIVANISGRWDEALGHYQRALTHFEQTGAVSRLAELHHNLGMTFLSKGDPEAAIRQFDLSLKYATQVHYEPLQGLSYLGKASAYAKMRDFRLSIVFADKALNIFRKVSDHLSIADSYKVKGIVQREMGNLDVAEAYLQTSVRLNEEYQSPLNLAESYFELGLIYKGRHEATKARDAFQKSIKFFRKIGAEREQKSVRAELADLERS